MNTRASYVIWVAFEPVRCSLFILKIVFFLFEILSGTGCISHTRPCVAWRNACEIPKRKSFSSIYEIINLCSVQHMIHDVRALDATSDRRRECELAKYKRANQNRCDATCPGIRANAMGTRPAKYLRSFATKRPVIRFEWHTNRLHCSSQSHRTIRFWSERMPEYVDVRLTLKIVERARMGSREHNVVVKSFIIPRSSAIRASFACSIFGRVWSMIVGHILCTAKICLASFFFFMRSHLTYNSFLFPVNSLAASKRHTNVV